MLEADLTGIKGLGPAKTRTVRGGVRARCGGRWTNDQSAPRARPHFPWRGARLPATHARRSASTRCSSASGSTRSTRSSTSEELFHGTLTQTSVYPREIVKQALARNAAAVIFAHNHPSGVAQPSQADELLTRNLQEALALVEVKVLDHFIVAGNQAISFAERGLL